MEKYESNNFIEEIVVNDLESGKHTDIQPKRCTLNLLCMN